MAHNLTKTRILVTLLFAGAFSLPAGQVFAVTTNQAVGACKRAKTCSAHRDSEGGYYIKTGSGGERWCPPEGDGKCVVLKPGGGKQ